MLVAHASQNPLDFGFARDSRPALIKTPKLDERSRGDVKSAVGLLADEQACPEQFEELWRLLGAPVNYTDPATGAVKTFTYQDAVEINAKLASDPVYRDRVYQAWREAARAKYQQVEELLNRFVQPPPQTDLTLYLAILAAAVLAALALFLLRKRK